MLLLSALNILGTLLGELGVGRKADSPGSARSHADPSGPIVLLLEAFAISVVSGDEPPVCH